MSSGVAIIMMSNKQNDGSFDSRPFEVWDSLDKARTSISKIAERIVAKGNENIIAHRPIGQVDDLAIKVKEEGSSYFTVQTFYSIQTQSLMS